MNPWARGFLIFVLAIGVLGFGAMGLCGGIFTVSVLTDVPAVAMLILTLPCLIGGIVMVVVCSRKILALLQAPSPNRDQHE